MAASGYLQYIYAPRSHARGQMADFTVTFSKAIAVCCFVFSDSPNSIFAKGIR
jgi:hypothetical protein